MNRRIWATCIVMACLVGPSLAQETQETGPKNKTPSRGQVKPRPKVEGVEHFRVESTLLSKFWGRPMFIEAGVVLPADHGSRSQPAPVCYSIHGFGGSHRTAWRTGPRLRKKMTEANYPRMSYVFLKAQFPLGHHEFADSVNNGPWGRALTEEFIPALEKKFGVGGTSEARFLTGHSSGGWSSLWLQVTYPEFFGGVWSTAPDSIDFRDFTGINIYEFSSAFVDPEGKEIPLVRKRGGGWKMTIREYVKGEVASRSYGGQFASFDAVFSPRDKDGRPMKLFDRSSGEIDPQVLESWKKYDIVLQLKRNWQALEPKLRGKLRIYVGALDTYRLEGAVRLAQADLKQLGSDARVVIVEGRDHGSLLAPHEKLWPEGLRARIHQEMWKRWRESDRTQ